MAFSLKALSATPLWPILAVLVLGGGVATLAYGVIELAKICQKYDDLYSTATDFESPVFLFTVIAAGLVLIFELMIAYSITSNKMRLRGIHCCSNWRTFNACNGAADLDDEPHRGLGRCCVLYSHVLLLLSWLNTLLALVQTAMGVALGTLVVVGAGVCWVDITVGAAPYTATVHGPEILAVAYTQFETSPFSFTMNNFTMSASWISAGQHPRTSACA
eukprot:1833940-Prymnesium_polylepis.2